MSKVFFHVVHHAALVFRGIVNSMRFVPFRSDAPEGISFLGQLRGPDCLFMPSGVNALGKQLLGPSRRSLAVPPHGNKSALP
jgi:hypothetical protein